MKFNRSIFVRAVVLISLMASLTVLSTRLQADTGSCGGVTITLPFTDVMGNAFFCQIAGAYFSGLTNGTSATTYSPTQNVTREQMAAFTTRTLDQSLKRGSQRAALNQWWTSQSITNFGLISVGDHPQGVQSDGQDLWVACAGGVVSRVRASDGKLLETWTGARDATNVLVAKGRVFITGPGTGSSLYMIDPRKPAGTVTTVLPNLLDFVSGIAFDGGRIWLTLPGGVMIVTPETWTYSTANSGFTEPRGILFDGTNIWVTDYQADKLLKLDSNGNIIQSIAVGDGPVSPIFDGTNIWVPNANSNSVTVVRVKDTQGNPLTSAFVLATLTGNGLAGPNRAAFDGQRILIVNAQVGTVALWKAADLTPIGTFPVSVANSLPNGACSDGINFWITLSPDKLARF